MRSARGAGRALALVLLVLAGLVAVPATAAEVGDPTAPPTTTTPAPQPVPEPTAPEPAPAPQPDPPVIEPAPTAEPEAMPETPASTSRNSTPIPDRYIVRLEPGDPAWVGIRAAVLSSNHNGDVDAVFEHALQGFVARMSEADANALAAEPGVADVVQDGTVHASASPQIAPPWGLDRIDEAALPLDGQYTYNSTGAGVHAYVLDGAVRLTHNDFGGRATSGPDFYENDLNSSDNCPAIVDGKPSSGHGTHVAGILGGSTHGVAKQVSLVAVRVLDCKGDGTFSDVVEALDWVAANAERPAVVNMSLGAIATHPVLEGTITTMVESGITVVVAAGNGDIQGNPVNACNATPARTPKAITVASTTQTDQRSSFSNFGTCVDLFGPGSQIVSAWRTGDSSTNTFSGTSMAAPHVAGVVARYLQSNPCASTDSVTWDVVVNTTMGVVGNPGSGSPNRLLSSTFLTTPGPVGPPCAFEATATAGVNKVTLEWNPTASLSPLTGYAVYRGTTPGGQSGTPIGEVGPSATSFTDTSAIGGTTYYYKVGAKSLAGETTSPEVSATPQAPTAPAAPNLSAVGGNKSVQLSWTVPADGGSPITGYQILRGITPGGESPHAMVGPGATSHVDTNTIVDGTPYYYKVAAVNAIGATPSNEVSATPFSSTGAYVSLPPQRILDSRFGVGLSGAWTPFQGRDLQVLGKGGVPASGVSAVVLNVTAVDPTASGHAVVFPTGVSPAPTASNLNFTPGVAVPNLVVVKVGTGGKARIVNHAPGTTHYLADVAGYFATEGAPPGPSGARYVGTEPKRAMDTRPGFATVDGQFAGGGAAGPNGTRSVTIAGRNALTVPANATAVVLNVTAVQPTQAGHLRVFPTGGALPVVSNVNFVPGQIVPNLVVVGVGTGGNVSVFNGSTGLTHAVVDVVGYYVPPPTAMSSYHALTPSRILDSRDGTGGFSTPWGANATRAVQVGGAGGVPPGATAAVLNVTVTAPAAGGHATVFPSNVSEPNASNLNFTPGLTVPNLVMVKLGDGKVKIRHGSAGTAHYIADVVGYYE